MILFDYRWYWRPLISTSISVSQEIRYRHPSIPKCSLQLQGVQNFKLHRSLLQSLAGHLHLLPIPGGKRKSLTPRPCYNSLPLGRLMFWCHWCTSWRCRGSCNQARNATMTCGLRDMWHAGLASLLPLFGCPNPSASRFFFKLSALKDRRKSFFRRFRGAIAWPAAGCQRKRRSFLNLQMYVLFDCLFDCLRVRNASNPCPGDEVDAPLMPVGGTFQLFVSVFKRSDPSGIIVFSPRLLMWWWLLVKSLQTRHHFTILWPSPNLTCSFCSMSRNAQGERLPELAEELEKLRAGLAVVGDQAGWKYLRHRCIGCNCAYVTYVSICFWWRLWGSQDTIQVKMPRFTKNLLEVGRSLANVFARNPDIIWVQRPEVIVKHAWTCEQGFFLKDQHYVFEGTPSEAV